MTSLPVPVPGADVLQVLKPADATATCSHCPVARYGIYQPTFKVSPQSVQTARAGIATYQASRIVVRQGQVSDYYGVLRSGWAYSYTALKDGGRHIQGFMIPGDTIALDLLVIGSNPISFGVKALTQVSICWFPVATMSRLLRRTAEQRRETQFWFAYYLNTRNSQASTISQGNAREKIAGFILEMHSRLRHRGLAKGDGYDFQPTQGQIGECLGLTSVSVNKALSEFQKRNILEIRNKTLRVFNETALQAIAEGDD